MVNFLPSLLECLWVRGMQKGPKAHAQVCPDGRQAPALHTKPNGPILGLLKASENGVGQRAAYATASVYGIHKHVCQLAASRKMESRALRIVDRTGRPDRTASA